VKVIALSIRDHDPKRKPARRHDDSHEPAGWAKHREPKTEPQAANKNIGDVGRWIARAEKHSGPAFAPGTGRKKS
jgi:hypothetical protein